MTDRGVEKEIEANEERAEQHAHDGESKLERAIDTIAKPITDVIDRLDGETVKEKELRDLENDRDHRTE